MDTSHARSLESAPALSGTLTLLVGGREVRATIERDTAAASPAREPSVIERARAAVIAHRASAR